MQSCLARLYVSDTFRTLFRADPAGTLAGYDLTAREAAALEAVDQRMLEVFAATLRNKRGKRLRRAYSASFAWNHAAMEAVLARHLEVSCARPAGTSHRDVLDFGGFAEQTLADPGRFPPAVAELLRFERLAYEATFVWRAVAGGEHAREMAPSDIPVVPAGVLIDDFGHDVVALDAALRAGEAAGDPPPSPNTVVFRPGRDAGEQRMLRVNGATALVLRLCDGRRTAAGVVGEAEKALRSGDLTAAVLGTLRRLAGLGVVTVAAREAEA